MTANPSQLPALLLLHPEDNVFVARRAIGPNESLQIEGLELWIGAHVPLGHKIARCALPIGAAVLKYGAKIGSTTSDVAPGEHLHLHNMKSDYLPPHTRQTRPRES